jgi:hypothetical protein
VKVKIEGGKTLGSTESVSPVCPDALRTLPLICHACTSGDLEFGVIFAKRRCFCRAGHGERMRVLLRASQSHCRLRLPL